MTSEQLRKLASIAGYKFKTHGMPDDYLVHKIDGCKVFHISHWQPHKDIKQAMEVAKALVKKDPVIHGISFYIDQDDMIDIELVNKDQGDVGSVTGKGELSEAICKAVLKAVEDE